jgi:putative sterol carrier protein
MTIPFPSDEWVKAFMADLNTSQSYLDAARNWEGDFYFTILPNGKPADPVTLYMDLWHGKCRDALLVHDPSTRTPAFTISGILDIWKKVMSKKLDPMQAMMTGQLKLVGNMAMVMKNVRAAKELVECCTRIPTCYIE